MTIQGFVDPVRAEIVRLEQAETFDPAAWDRVFATLRAQGRTAGYEDAWRRMCTAMDNATSFLPDPSLIDAVAVETGMDVGSMRGDRCYLVIADLGVPGARFELTLNPISKE